MNQLTASPVAAKASEQPFRYRISRSVVRKETRRPTLARPTQAVAQSPTTVNVTVNRSLWKDTGQSGSRAEPRQQRFGACEYFVEPLFVDVVDE